MPFAVRDEPSSGEGRTTSMHPTDAPPGAARSQRADDELPEVLGQAGLDAFEAGRLEEGLELIDRALSRRPEAALLHRSRCAILRGMNRLEDALAPARQAVALAPGDALAWQLLGDTLRDLGRSEEALRAYQEATLRDAGLVEPQLHRGLLLAELGRDPEALAACEAAVAAAPDFGRAQAALGRMLQRAGRLPEAIDHYRRAVSLLPDLSSVYCDLGAALSEAGDQEAAAEALQTALTLDPDRPEAHLGLGRVCEALGYHDQALSAYRRAILERPDYAAAHFVLGGLLMTLQRPAEALASFRAAVTFRADHAAAHAGMGAALVRLGRSGEAISHLSRGLELEPTRPEVWCQLGQALEQERRSRDAATAYGRAIILRPEFAEAHWRRAQALLSAGTYDDAWMEYAWRDRIADAPAPPTYPVPRWVGGALDGRTILVHGDGSPADVLFFARYLPLVAARGGRVILECHPGLRRLLEAMPHLAQVIERGTGLPEIDCHAALEDLPVIFRTRLASVPSAVPYLPLRTWSGRIPALPAGSGLRVGVVGSPAMQGLPEEAAALRALTELYGLPGVTWYFLSRRDRGSAGEVPAERVRDLVPLMRDLSDAAALLTQLDLVIGTDTTLAHLAGGLGLPLWILLDSGPTWRWVTESGETPWYPTARAFRQPRPGDWAGALTELRATLAALIAAVPGSAVGAGR